MNSNDLTLYSGYSQEHCESVGPSARSVNRNFGHCYEAGAVYYKVTGKSDGGGDGDGGLDSLVIIVVAVVGGVVVLVGIVGGIVLMNKTNEKALPAASAGAGVASQAQGFPPPAVVQQAVPVQEMVQMGTPMMVQPQMAQPMVPVAPAAPTAPAVSRKFDPQTGQPLPKFDPMTGVQNW